MTSNCGGRTVRVVALAALLVLAGCATIVNGAGRGSKPGGASSSADFPSGVIRSASGASTNAASPAARASAPGRTAAVLPRTAGATTTAGAPIPTAAVPTPAATVQSRDIGGVDYRVPAGWVRNANYVQVIPLESSYQAKYLIPSSAAPGLDVIAIVLYRLPTAHLVDTPDQQVARITAYNQKRNVTVKRALERTRVGGLPAFDESVVQPGGSAGEFHYVAWFVFGGAHVVQITCQVGSHADVVATGCQRVLNSVTFG